MLIITNVTLALKIQAISISGISPPSAESFEKLLIKDGGTFVKDFRCNDVVMQGNLFVEMA